MPVCSTRPYSREVPRCEQWSAMRPSRSVPSRNSTNSSANNFIFVGVPFGFTSWLNATGHQNLRNISPAGVPDPTRVNSSFSSFDNINALRNQYWSSRLFKNPIPVLQYSITPVPSLLLQQFGQLFFQLQAAVFALQIKRDRLLRFLQLHLILFQIFR